MNTETKQEHFFQDQHDKIQAEKLENIVNIARKKHPIVEVANWDDEIRAAS